MAIVLTGTKTVTKDVAPHLTHTQLTALLATAIESLTVKQLNELLDAVSRVPTGGDPNAVIGDLLP
jgi:hypothetical protein